jgi:hypothetical protein
MEAVCLCSTGVHSHSVHNKACVFREQYVTNKICGKNTEILKVRLG